jgi:hypothetical protein
VRERAREAQRRHEAQQRVVVRGVH